MSSVLNTSATLQSAVYNEYELEGGIKVRDATEGRVKAEFSKIDTHRKVFKILIENSEVFSPANASTLQFIGSESLKFKEKEGYIHIKEVDKDGEVTRVYVSVQKVQEKGSKLFFSLNKPCLLTEEQLNQRLNLYKDKWLNSAKEIQIVAHNKHGVVVVGWDKASDGPFYGSKQKPFVAISHADDEKWFFYPGRDFGRYSVSDEADGKVKIMQFTSRNSEALEIHRYYDKDTNEEKIAINSEEAEKLSPEWMNI